MRIQPFYCDAAWAKFVGQLDLEVFVGGLGRDIDSWRYGRRFFESDPYWRLYLPLKGAFRLVYPEQAFVVEPGHIYLVPPNLPFRFETVTPSDHYFIHFISRRLWRMESLRTVRLSGISSEPRARRRFRSLLASMRKAGDVFGAIAIRNNLSESLAPFMATGSGMPPPTDTDDVFARALEHIDERLGDNNLLVDELAGIAHLPRAAFSAEFRRRFGLPPKQYISSRRVGRAKYLLLRTQLNIKEIAAQCGFGNELFFYRLFRKYAHIAPGEYREQNKFD